MVPWLSPDGLLGMGRAHRAIAERTWPVRLPHTARPITSENSQTSRAIRSYWFNPEIRAAGKTRPLDQPPVGG
jgi:hypothetical protein